jgi:hypothetical protein
MWAAVLPIDVAKTRLQTARPGSDWDVGLRRHWALVGCVRGDAPSRSSRKPQRLAGLHLGYEIILDLGFSISWCRSRTAVTSHEAAKDPGHTVAMTFPRGGGWLPAVRYPAAAATRPNRPPRLRVSHVPSQLLREGGVASLYAGLTPTLIRAYPANACQWLAWELVMRGLHQHGEYDAP